MISQIGRMNFFSTRKLKKTKSTKSLGSSTLIPTQIVWFDEEKYQLTKVNDMIKQISRRDGKHLEMIEWKKLKDDFKETSYALTFEGETSLYEKIYSNVKTMYLSEGNVFILEAYDGIPCIRAEYYPGPYSNYEHYEQTIKFCNQYGFYCLEEIYHYHNPIKSWYVTIGDLAVIKLNGKITAVGKVERAYLNDKIVSLKPSDNEICKKYGILYPTTSTSSNLSLVS